jgi:hypothetical protein
MTDERFVRVLIANEEEESPKYGPVWGLFSDDTNRDHGFRLMFTRSRVVQRYFDEDDGCLALNLYDCEIECMVDADETNTPDKAWAALAKYRLTGEI